MHILSAFIIVVITDNFKFYLHLKTQTMLLRYLI